MTSYVKATLWPNSTFISPQVKQFSVQFIHVVATHPVYNKVYIYVNQTLCSLLLSPHPPQATHTMPEKCDQPEYQGNNFNLEIAGIIFLSFLGKNYHFKETMAVAFL